jgi:hypothetical protein
MIAATSVMMTRNSGTVRMGERVSCVKPTITRQAPRGCTSSCRDAKRLGRGSSSGDRARPVVSYVLAAIERSYATRGGSRAVTRVARRSEFIDCGAVNALCFWSPGCWQARRVRRTRDSAQSALRRRRLRSSRARLPAGCRQEPDGRQYGERDRCRPATTSGTPPDQSDAGATVSGSS